MPIEVKVPEVGESITEVYIGEWHKAEGDAVNIDEELVEIESEKATFDVRAAAAGTLVKILKQPGETAEVGEVIAHIEPGDVQAPASRAAKPETAAASAEPAAKSAKPARPAPAPATLLDRPAPDSAEKPSRKGAEPATAPEPLPAARRVLAQNNLAAADVAGSGKGGRLLKEDVLRHLDEQSRVLTAPTAPHGEREEEAVPMSPIRQQIAKRLVEAQHAAALLTTFNEVDMSAVMALREKHRDAFMEKYGVKLGFMSFFVKATVDALLHFPQVNSEIRDKTIVYHNYCDIGVAIGSGRGLVVPVLRDAERLSFADVELAINDFARRAENNGLKLAELRGGTFTISNGGVYGSLLSTPIVNPPQSGVLGMHAIQQRPVVIDGQIVARPMMYLALTYDHRVVDGREAVSFLRRIKEVIEDPARMLIEI